ncbi:MAG: MFS transporter [Myxococcota bacterium]|nr:MFS transporter [Myxococcota bacterium]
MTTRSQLTLWYILFLGAVGAFHPYLAVVLDDAGARGLAKAGILSLFPLGSILAGPTLTWVADRTGRGVLVLRIALIVTAAASIALALDQSLPWMVAWICVLSFSRAPTSSIVDMLTVGRLGMGRTGYGGVRAWGSVGFILAAATVSLFLDELPLIPLWSTAGLLVGLAVLTMTIRSERRPVGPQERASISTLLSNRALLGVYFVAILHQATISFYDHFYALHITRTLRDLPSWTVGASIIVGVGLEVLVLVNGHRLLKRFGPLTLVLMGVASGIPRGLITAGTTDPALLIGTQALHGLGFGAWWVGAIALVSSNAPEKLRNSAQGLFMASSHGLGTLLAMGTAALLLDRASTTAVFYANSGLSVLALVAALLLIFPAARRGAGLSPGDRSERGH